MSATKRLRRARKIRHQMASQLRQLENGGITIWDVLEDPSPTLKRVRVYDVMRRTPKLGSAGAKKILMRLEIWPMERVGNLSLNKRRKILAALPERVRNNSRPQQADAA